MKAVKITRLGEGNKVAYNAAGERFFIPNSLRAEIKVGLHAIVNDETFDSRTKTDDQGQPVIENGQPVIEKCEPWTRTSVTMVGTKEIILSAKAESSILDIEEAAFVAQATTQVKETYKLSDEQFAKLQAAL